MDEPNKHQITHILKKHFDVPIKSIDRINEGYTHYMYDCVVGETNVVLRISYNEKEESCLAKELLVMEEYGKKNIPIPKIYAFDIQKIDFPFDKLLFLGYWFSIY